MAFPTSDSLRVEAEGESRDSWPGLTVTDVQPFSLHPSTKPRGLKTLAEQLLSSEVSHLSSVQGRGPFRDEFQFSLSSITLFSYQVFVLLPLNRFNPIPFQVEISFYSLPFLSLAYLTLLSPTLFIFSSTSSLNFDSNSC